MLYGVCCRVVPHSCENKPPAEDWLAGAWVELGNIKTDERGNKTTNHIVLPRFTHLLFGIREGLKKPQTRGLAQPPLTPTRVRKNKNV